MQDASSSLKATEFSSAAARESANMQRWDKSALLSSKGLSKEEPGSEPSRHGSTAHRVMQAGNTTVGEVSQAKVDEDGGEPFNKG